MNEQRDDLLKNVGAPTFKVLLEGFRKEFVFTGIGDSGETSFQIGNWVVRITPQKRWLSHPSIRLRVNRTPNVGAPTLKVILEVMRAPLALELCLWLAPNRRPLRGRIRRGLAA